MQPGLLIRWQNVAFSANGTLTLKSQYLTRDLLSVNKTNKQLKKQQQQNNFQCVSTSRTPAWASSAVFPDAGNAVYFGYYQLIFIITWNNGKFLLEDRRKLVSNVIMRRDLCSNQRCARQLNRLVAVTSSHFCSGGRSAPRLWSSLPICICTSLTAPSDVFIPRCDCSLGCLGKFFNLPL